MIAPSRVLTSAQREDALALVKEPRRRRELSSMSVGAIKKMLKENNVDTSDCFERSELEQRVRE